MPHTPKEPVTSTALKIILRAFSCLSDLFFAPTISKRPLLIFDDAVSSLVVVAVFLAKSETVSEADETKTIYIRCELPATAQEASAS